MTNNQSVNLNRLQLLEQGIFIQQMTPRHLLDRLIRAICPQKTKFELVRLGSDGDGGYLIPNDLEGITDCFSPGVDANASFEQDLLEKYSIGSHLADYSVAAPPGGFLAKSFTKKYLGAFDSPIVMTLDSWIAEQTVAVGGREFILQMDIEGAEYDTLLSISNDNLKKFRILVIEFHNVVNWGNPVFFRIVSSLFEKLLQNFMVVHNHPNNSVNLVNLGGTVVPPVFELTLLRRDRAASEGNRSDFPHKLDRPNVPSNRDLVLPKNWYMF